MVVRVYSDSSNSSNSSNSRIISSRRNSGNSGACRQKHSPNEGDLVVHAVPQHSCECISLLGHLQAPSSQVILPPAMLVDVAVNLHLA